MEVLICTSCGSQEVQLTFTDYEMHRIKYGIPALPFPQVIFTVICYDCQYTKMTRVSYAKSQVYIGLYSYPYRWCIFSGSYVRIKRLEKTEKDRSVE